MSDFPLNNRDRFQRPVEGEQYESEYDMSSDQIDDMIKRNPDAIEIYQLDLSAAGTQQFLAPGYGFVMYGYDRSTGAKYPEAFVNVGINVDNINQDTSRVFPCKTGRGFMGAFARLFLSWPADGNNPLVKFVVFKSPNYPWIGGLEAS